METLNVVKVHLREFTTAKDMHMLVIMGDCDDKTTCFVRVMIKIMSI